MLLKLQRVIEVTARAQMFITSFIPSIRENQDLLPDSFVESWVFSACMNVVNECEPLSAQLIANNTDLIVPYNAVKADLLLTARRQLDKIGVKCKHLPMTNPFSIYIDKEEKDVEKSLEITNDNGGGEFESKKLITNIKLLEAIESVEAFDKTYMVKTKYYKKW
jgi:hypothetical protein